MSRPKLLVTTAKMGAKKYHRTRDLPGAIPGLLSQPAEQILPKLAAAEEKIVEDLLWREQTNTSFRQYGFIVIGFPPEEVMCADANVFHPFPINPEPGFFPSLFSF